jgi:amino acid adenylation domain-containing protein
MPETPVRFTASCLAGSDSAIDKAARMHCSSPAVPNLPPEQEAIRAKCFHPTGTFVEFTADEIEQSIPDRFEKIVRLYPDRLAIKSEDQSLTYSDLNRAANRIAAEILVREDDRKQPIALLFEPGTSAICAILGVLNAGRMYVPLDPSFPRERLKSILEDSEASLILTNSANSAFARSLRNSETQLLDLDTIEPSESSDDLHLSLSPELFACILYTSGSTGEPKGVVQNHRSILHRAMIYTNLLHVGFCDRLTLLHSYSVGSCIHHLFGALLTGASIFPFDPRLSGGSRLARWLIRERISIYHSTPAVFRQMATEKTGEETFVHLRAINVSGAPMSSSDMELHAAHFPSQSVVVHMMGSTETGWIRHFFMDKNSRMTRNVVPVGYPIDNKDITLLGDNGEHVGANEVGEIAVESRYLSSGYWGKTELTRSKFLPADDGSNKRIYLTGDLGLVLSDGCLLHVGRKDLRIKLRGHRIEIGELEAFLSAQSKIREAAVVKRLVEGTEEGLIAYIVPQENTDLTVTELRRLFRENFPPYMAPSRFVFLHALPLMPNGKTDRRALPEPGKARPDLNVPFVLPRTPVEKRLAQIWADILSLDTVGAHDNFLDAGGHSLAAARIVARAGKSFGVDLSIESLFAAPTVAQFAVVVVEQQATGIDAEALTALFAEVEGLRAADARRALNHEADGDE